MNREHDPNSTPGRRALASQLKTALEARTLQRSVCRVTIGYTVGGTLTLLPRRLALRSDVATPIQITAKRAQDGKDSDQSLRVETLPQFLEVSEGILDGALAETGAFARAPNDLLSPARRIR